MAAVSSRHHGRGDAPDADRTVEDNILYEILVYTEWQEPEVILKNPDRTDDLHLSRTSSPDSKSWWPSIRPWAFPSCFSLPEAVTKLKDNQMVWQIAVGEEGKLVAVLMEQFLEIRSSKEDYATVVGKTPVCKDPYPQWRKLCWSSDCSMVAVAYSNGNVDAFDVIGTKLFSINNIKENLNSGSDCGEALAGLIFSDLRVKKTQWSSELILCSYKGQLRSYFVSPTDGYQEYHSFSFMRDFPYGVTALCQHPVHNLLFVSGVNPSSEDGQTHISSDQYGITAWRILSDEPYYKLVTTLEQEKAKLSRNLFRRLPHMFSWKGKKEDTVFKLSVSPAGHYMAALHSSGTLSIWSIPSMRLKRLWQLAVQPDFDAISPALLEYSVKKRKLQATKDELYYHLADVSWWSEMALILARTSGAVTVSSLKTLKNLLGNSCEWFEPFPQLTSATSKGFITLECEQQIVSKKRSGSEDDDNYEDSSDEDDPTLLSRSSKFVKTALFYMTDSERFQPPRRRPKILTKMYRLTCLKSTTPEELYSRKMDLEEYGEALALAKAYNLDTDLVYQRQWRKKAVSVASIQDYLSKITKRSWVLHECLERVPDNIDAAQELLMYGLRGTDLEALIMIGKGEDQGRFILCECRDDEEEEIDYSFEDENISSTRQQELLKKVDFAELNLEQKQLCQIRRKLLGYVDRLHTYECMLGGAHKAAERFNPKFFQKFRCQQAVDAAVEFAREGNWEYVAMMFTYHGSETLPHRLAILSNFPETLSPYDYCKLLPEAGYKAMDPQVHPWKEAEHREPDWVEQELCSQSVISNLAEPEFGLYEEFSHLAKFQESNLSKELLTDWYITRAKEIEQLSCLVDNALELVTLGRKRNVQGLESLHDDLITLETLVYECRVDCSLEKYEHMKDIDRIHLLMSTSSDDVFIKNLRRWVMPFLERQEKGNPGARRNLLREYMVSIAETGLAQCVLICDNSRIESAHPIIPTLYELMDTALECAYACENDNQLNEANSLLECLPSRGYGPISAEGLKLHDWVDEFEKHLRSAFILARNDVHKPIHYFRDVRDRPDEVKQLLIKLTRAAGRRSPALTVSQWDKVLSDILELQKTFRCVSPDLCHEIYTESLLCSSSKANITLAARLMECSKTTAGALGKKVGYHQAVDLVLKACREYFNSSSSLTDPCMDLARACLDLIADDNSTVEAERDLISALAMLSEFNVAILPLQVRLAEDRLHFVEQAMENKARSYQNPQRLLKLAQLLRVSGDDKFLREGRVLTLAANTAFQSEDYPICYNLCQQLMQGGHSLGWEVCRQLGQSTQFTDLEARCQLLSFAVAHCPSDQIEVLIKARCLLETQVLQQKIHVQMDISTDSDSEVYMDAMSDSCSTPDESGNLLNWSSSFNQTRDITMRMFQATTQTTKDMLATVGRPHFWKRTVNWMRPLRQLSAEDMMDDVNNNSNLTLQGCHAFYSGMIQPCHISQLGSDYLHYGMPLENRPALDFSLMLLRTALLAENLTLGENSCMDSAVLLQLIQDVLPEDTSLGLAYLLSLKKAGDAISSLETLPKTDISLQIICYYFALQILAKLRVDVDITQSHIYLQDPASVIKAALHYSANLNPDEMDSDIGQCAKCLRQYDELLCDLVQGQILDRLSRGVDIIRFSQDAEYKRETILGLAMTLDDEVYNTSVGLAQRYNIPLGEIFTTHIEYLFAETELSTQEIENRINNLSLVSELCKQPKEFELRLAKHVYPTISGTDHSRLILYYQLLEQCGSQATDSLAPNAHVKLLRKVRSAAPDLDYKRLMNSKTDASVILLPLLTNSNVQMFAKMAPQLLCNDGKLESSSILCMWAQKLFFKGDQNAKKMPSTPAEWIHRYESCGEFLHKFQPRNVIEFIKGTVLGEEGVQKLLPDTRREIVRRTLKHVNQQVARTQASTDRAELQKCVGFLNASLSHLEWVQSELVQELVRSDDPLLRRYVQLLDLAQSQPDKVEAVLEQCIIEGHPMEVLQQLVGICPPSISIAPADIVTSAIRNVTEVFSNAAADDKQQPEEPLDALKLIVKQIKQHLQLGGELIMVEDILDVLRPFCAHDAVPIEIRLQTMQLLEEAFTLEDEDVSLLLMYKTQVILAAGWPDVEVFPEDTETETSREELFNKVYASCHSLSQVLVLVKLLETWPSLPSSGKTNSPENPWYRLLLTLAESAERDRLDQCVNVFKKVSTGSSRLSLELTQNLLDKLGEHESIVHITKMGLLSEYEELHAVVVQRLQQTKSLDDCLYDSEVFDLVLLRHVTVQVVMTALYGPLISHLLDSQDESVPSHYSIPTIIQELKDGGHHPEAGTLLLKSRATHSSLQTFQGALAVLQKWMT